MENVLVANFQFLLVSKVAVFGGCVSVSVCVHGKEWELIFGKKVENIRGNNELTATDLEPTEPHNLEYANAGFSTSEHLFPKFELFLFFWLKQIDCTCNWN